MTRAGAVGPDSAKLYTYLEIPIGASATGMPPEKRKTGLWRYVRPVLEDRLPPCQDSCPAGNWIQRFLAAAGAGDEAAAVSALRLENPFPGLSGRVCYHPCETACNRRDLDGALAVHAVERHLADRFLDRPIAPPVRREPSGKTAAVVGGGPAGLACAYFLTLLGHEATVFEASDRLGGVPALGIPAYRLPREILDREIGRILDFGVKAETGVRVGRDLKLAALLDRYQAVFLATGAHLSPSLNIPGEDLKGVHRGLDFLAGFNRGLAPEPGDKVLVVGGGNVAVDVVRTLLRLGRSPAILYRRSRAEMPAHEGEIAEALAEGAKLECLLSPTAIRSGGNGGLSVECLRMKLDGADESGRAKAVPAGGPPVVFQADQVILATGERPDLDYLNPNLETAGGFVAVNGWGRTSHPRIFAGGDMVDQPWTVADAIGSAKRAAIAMDHFLRGEDPDRLAEEGRLARTMRDHLGLAAPALGAGRTPATLGELNRAYITPAPAAAPRLLPVEGRLNGFMEVDQGLPPDSALAEAGRCLSCGVCKACGNCHLFCPDAAVQKDPATGRFAIDYDYCKGCGICRTECPTAAIRLEAEGEEHSGNQ